MRVALFVTCFNDLLFPSVGEAVVRLMQYLGHEIEFPEGQTCCGQLHFNTGYRDECVPLVRRFTRVFGEYEAVITPSASCAAMVRQHHATVASDAGDDHLLDAVRSTVPRVYELTEFLVDVLGVTDLGSRFPHRVALHPTCHSVRLMGIGDRPQRLLAAIDGLTLVELPGADQCCGFGGTFAIKNRRYLGRDGGRQDRSHCGQRCGGGNRGRHVLSSPPRRDAGPDLLLRAGHAPR